MDYVYGLPQSLLAERPGPVQHLWAPGRLHAAGLMAAKPIAMSTLGYKATARRFACRVQAEGRLDE
jgi:hypothetical protein